MGRAVSDARVLDVLSRGPLTSNEVAQTFGWQRRSACRVLRRLHARHLVARAPAFPHGFVWCRHWV